MKIKIQLVLLSLGLISMVLTGCTTMADAMRARGTGEKVIYEASFDELWPAMPDAITAAGLRLVSMNRDDHQILAERGITAFSYGENVAVFIEKVDETKTSVEVVSKKVMTTNIFAPDWAGPIFAQLDERFKKWPKDSIRQP